MSRERQAQSRSTAPRASSKALSRKAFAQDAQYDLAEPEAQAATAPPSGDPEPDPRAALASPRGGPLPPIRRRQTLDDPRAPIKKGSIVRVLGGPLRGKTGVVQTLDARGTARVLIGLMAARVELTELIVVAAGRARPVLTSSHRKPPAPA